MEPVREEIMGEITQSKSCRPVFLLAAFLKALDVLKEERERGTSHESA